MNSTPDRPAKTPPAPLVISAHELYPAREAARRLRWGKKCWQRAQRDGLKTVVYGREKYVRGAELLRFFQALEQAGPEVKQ